MTRFFLIETIKNESGTGQDHHRFGPFNTVREAGDEFYRQLLGSDSPEALAVRYRANRHLPIGEVLSSWREALLRLGRISSQGCARGSWKIVNDSWRIEDEQ